MTHFAVAGLQLELTAQDNLEIVRAEMERLKRRFPWVDMVVLGELSLRGPQTSNAEPLPGPLEQSLCQVARDLKLWFVPARFSSAMVSTSTTPPGYQPSRRGRGASPQAVPVHALRAGCQLRDEFVVFDVPGAGRVGL